jgi:hypothetical protein
MPTAEPLARWQAFHLVKAGNTPAEYEDAFAVDASRARFAVADGATEASFAAAWARLLAEGFVAARRAPWRDLGWLAPARQRWSAEVDALPLPWYAEDKREQGAFATFLGMAFRAPGPDGPGLWRALAIGDSCLFRIRAGQPIRAFPLTHSEQFGSHPRLIGSRSRGGEVGRSRDRTGGHWRGGDRFLLMTDALAQWCLRRNEQGAEPAAVVAALLAESDPQAAFAGWVEERRREDGMRNDDVTLLVIDPCTGVSP